MNQNELSVSTMLLKVLRISVLPKTYTDSFKKKFIKFWYDSLKVRDKWDDITII